LRRPARANTRQSLSSRVSDAIDIILYGPLAIIRHIWIQLILLLFMFGFGTVVFVDYQHLNILTAFLGSVSTITTIGIYAPPIVGMSPTEQVLLIVTFIVSVGLAASIVQSIITAAISREILREQLVGKKIQRMEGHVVLLGYSYLGKYVSEWLAHMKVRQVIITRDRNSAKAVTALGLPVIEAPTTRSFDALKRARVDRASTLVCCLDDDADNLLVAMNARKLNRDLRILMVVHDREIVESASASDVDVVIPIFDVAARALAFSAVAREVTGILLPDRQEAEVLQRMPYILEFSIDQGRGAGMTFGALDKVSPILMVIRDRRAIPNPPDDFQFAKGDSMLVLGGSPLTIEKFRQALSPAADTR
jgi:Trk K+ transport system NAD-binding subunit